MVFLWEGGGTYFLTNYSLVKKEKEELSKKTITTSPIKKDFDSFFYNSFNDDFFSPNFSPFKQMEKMRQNMDKLFGDHLGQLKSGSHFDNWFKGKFGGSVFDIEQKEDDKYTYYEIKLEGLDQNNLKINVVDGMLEISGEIIKTEESNSSSGISKSQVRHNFHRSFPVPSGADSEKVDFETEDDKLVVKFPKNDSNVI